MRYGAPDAHPTTMRTLSRFFENPFDDDGISLAELLAFTTDHLQRMIANNASGELDAHIAATTSGLALLEEHAGDDQTKLGIRKARKMVMRAYRDGVDEKVAKVIGKVVGQYGPDSAVEVECCPQGRTIFHTCTDDKLAGHLQTLIDGVGAYVDDLGAPVVAEATAIKTGWLSVYAASESAGGAKTATQDGKKAARENLQLMLFLNLLKLAEMFPRQKAKCALYMQQSLLEDHPQQEEEPPTNPPPTQ